MKEKEKISVLFRIAEAFGKSREKNAEPERFDSLTGSLYAVAPDVCYSAIPDDYGFQPEIILEEKDYQDAVHGIRTFVVMKDAYCYIGKTLIIHETKNFVPTGRVLPKVITCVERNNSFLKDGYCVVCWGS